MREAGAVPATIGLLDGRVRVGLSEAELARFDASARKVGPRDLAAAVVQDSVGATTVGGTLAVCRAAGISVMATGGLGGVHRGWAEHLDVSLDLGELARTRCVVVSLRCEVAARRAGNGGGARGARKCRCSATAPTSCRFSTPRAEGRRSPRASRGAEEAASIARAHWELGGGGVLLARPPDESLDDVEPLIEHALRDARERGVSGKNVTPFVLSWLHERSGGRTLAANRALVVANAGLAAQVALER